jgi:hypothetical protein
MQGVPYLYPRHRIGTTATLDICSLSRDNRREETRRLRGTNPDAERLRRGVERVLSFRQTCRIRGCPTFPLLVEAVRCRFKGTTPDLRWITHQEPLLACATL